MCCVNCNRYHIYAPSSIINYSTVVTSWRSVFRRTFIGIDLCICKHTHLFFFFFSSTSTNIPTLLFPASSHYDTLKRRSTPNTESLFCNNHGDSCQPRAGTCKKWLRTHTENMKILSALEMQHPSLFKGDVISNCVGLSHSNTELSYAKHELENVNKVYLFYSASKIHLECKIKFVFRSLLRCR